MADYMAAIRALMSGKLSEADKKILADAEKKKAEEAKKKPADPKAMEKALKDAVNPLGMFRKK